MKTHFLKTLRAACGLAMILESFTASAADEAKAPRAARSVHLQYPAPASTAFYNEVKVEESQIDTYFCVCGFNQGYFGIQQLKPSKERVVIFSVWDPGKQNDPNSVAADQRVELLYKADDVRTGRFGGEGTGGQSFFNYPWKTGEAYKFMVTGVTNENKTTFTGYFFLNETGQWKKLVTFRTLSKGKPLGGYYSFVEDFRRDGKSPLENRRAHYGNGWVKMLTGGWKELTEATFTGDSTPLDNIDAGASGMEFFLQTGGNTVNHVALKTKLTRPPSGLKAPEDPLPEMPQP